MDQMDQQIEVFDNIRKELKRYIEQGEKQSEESSPGNEENYKFSSNLLPDTEIYSAAYSIDDDIIRMRAELQRSCKLFQSAGETFESISFEGLKHRIKDLNLTADKSDMDAVMQEKGVDQSLNKLTKIMGKKFGQHPGEFGDIPELSSFFRACNQLQSGLEALQKQRLEMNRLGARMTAATNESRRRINDMRKVMKDENININI